MADARGGPPGPEGLPVLGNTLELVREQGDFFERLADYGPVARMRVVGIGEAYVVTDPDLVERVLVSDRDAFEKGELARDRLGDLLGEGLVLSEGDLWRRQRQRIQPAFYRDRVTAYADVMADQSRRLAATLSPGDRIDVEAAMDELALRILVKAMFGSDLDYEGRGVGETVAALQEPGLPRNQPLAYAVPKWVPIPMWRRYNRAAAEMEDLIFEVIAEKRAALSGANADADADADADVDADGDGNPADADLVSMLLSARDESGDRMSEKLVRDELMTFLNAGHETTASALTFAWTLLSDHPSADARLHEELDAVLGGDPPTAADLSDLTYLDRVLTEAMRLYPPVPSVPREASRDVELGGYEVPAGTTVVASQWAIHRDERFYDDPAAFRPERWADGLDDRLPRFAYFPFGGGPRRCIGEQFALLEAKLAVATLAQRYRLERTDDAPVDPAVSVTTRPASEIEVVVRERE